MSLLRGTTLGPYTVTAKIGEGGMGEVYQARDTKLDRDVALKVLPEAFTSDRVVSTFSIVAPKVIGADKDQQRLGLVRG